MVLLDLFRQLLALLGQLADLFLDACRSLRLCLAVELVRRGSPAVNLPVGVRYLSRDEGGVSHFRPFRDNLRFSWMHCKLCTLGCIRWTLRVLWPFSRRQR